MKKPGLLKSSELFADTPRAVKVLRLLTNCAILINCSFTLIPNKELLAYILYVLDDQRWTEHGTSSPWQQHHLPELWHGTLLVECRCWGEMLCPRIALPSVWRCSSAQDSKQLITPYYFKLLILGKNKNDRHLSNIYWMAGIVHAFFLWFIL